MVDGQVDDGRRVTWILSRFTENRIVAEANFDLFNRNAVIKQYKMLVHLEDMGAIDGSLFEHGVLIGYGGLIEEIR
jgi:hypothetical protein